MFRAQTILTFQSGERRLLLAVDHRAALNPWREGVSWTAIGAQRTQRALKPGHRVQIGTTVCAPAAATMACIGLSRGGREPLLGSLHLMPVTDTIEAFLAEPRTVIVAGTRRDGRPQLTPNWFHWDGECFYVSTTRTRAKYRIFKRDPRAELVVDDSTGGRCVLVSGIAEIREDIEPELHRFRAIREKHGVPVPSDDEFLASLSADDRVLLVIAPNVSLSSWTTWGLD